ncbi:tetratricopeptide repeat protein [Thalassotalea sp. Y01]|uniref:tetratricopeptide repeat protein n=1 Tax=Thalassotalea sp. Y01 TaxID=2729613 RepID=UPI00145F1D25|nr:tetratricopeptide repeat protein [Thalassotalea sp. Y01]NMP17635.1 sel1 repeat family protein [Thalassotalea sp. Y01]
MKAVVYNTMLFLIVSAIAMSSDALANKHFVNIPNCDSEECLHYFKEYKRKTREGYADAMETLASFYHVGYGTEVNLELALKWYKRAAKYFSVVGSYKAGVFLLTEPDYYDFEQGVSYLKKAGRAKYGDANYLLTVIYTSEEFIDADYQKADKWLTYALQGKHDKSIAYCKYMLANNVMTEQRFSAAYELCQKAQIKPVTNTTEKIANAQQSVPINESDSNTSSVIAQADSDDAAPKGEMEVIEVTPMSLPEMFEADLAYLKNVIAEKRRMTTGSRIYRRPCSLTLSCSEMQMDEFARIRNTSGAGMLNGN